MARAIAPSGSTACSRVPASAPKPSKNHQGTPFMAVRTTVSGPSSGPMPVRLADAEAATLLSPGSVVDLVLASGDTGARIVAEGVQVVTVPRISTSAGLGRDSRIAGSLIVVATDRRTAVALAAAGTQPGLGVVLR